MEYGNQLTIEKTKMGCIYKIGKKVKSPFAMAANGLFRLSRK